MLLKIYLSGVISTLSWDLYWATYRFLTKRSLLDNNMSQLGLRRSMITGNYRVGGNIYKEIAILLSFIILTSLTSWIGFCFELGNTLHSFFKNQGEPQELKEIKWKLKNVPLKAEEVAELDIKSVEIQRGKRFSKDQLQKIQDAYEKRGLKISISGEA